MLNQYILWNPVDFSRGQPVKHKKYGPQMFEFDKLAIMKNKVRTCLSHNFIK